VHDDVCAADKVVDGARVPHVASHLVDRRLERGVVERHDVERPDVVSLVEQPSREVKAEKPGST
jgi:hypothetical protein